MGLQRSRIRGKGGMVQTYGWAAQALVVASGTETVELEVDEVIEDEEEEEEDEDEDDEDEEDDIFLEE
jgi:hypothetical protein